MKPNMSNRFLTLFVLILCSVATAGSSQQGETKRTVLGVTLGDPREEIERIFSEADIKLLHRDESVTAYAQPPVRIANGGTSVLVFHRNRLAKIGMIIDVQSMSAKTYISRYEELKKALTEKYGAPTKSNEWIDPDYRDHQLLAFKTGKGFYYASWKLPDLHVGLHLYGDNYEMNFNVSYEYVPLFQEYIKDSKKKEKEKL